jgi:hypothetical protein
MPGKQHQSQVAQTKNPKACQLKWDRFTDFSSMPRSCLPATMSMSLSGWDKEKILQLAAFAASQSCKTKIKQNFISQIKSCISVNANLVKGANEHKLQP